MKIMPCISNKIDCWSITPHTECIKETEEVFDMDAVARLQSRVRLFGEMPAILMPAGLRVIGSSKFGNASPHWVDLTEHYMSLSPVTIGQFHAIMRNHKSFTEICGFWSEKWNRLFDPIKYAKHPMTCVNVEDTEAFFKEFNSAVDCKMSLPTEAERESAMRSSAIDVWDWLLRDGIIENGALEISRERFLQYAEGRLENFFIELGADIFAQASDVPDEFLKAPAKDVPRLQAYRQHGTPNGKIDGMVQLPSSDQKQGPWWNQGNTGDRFTRPIEVEWPNREVYPGNGSETFNELVSYIELGLIHPDLLSDACGNVWWWCRDRYDENAYRQRIDGDRMPDPFHQRGRFQVVRGGSWYDDDPDCLRAAFRGSTLSGYSLESFGFGFVARPQDSFICS